MEYLILFLPLIGSIISGFFGKTIGDRLSQLITCILVSISALLSLFIFFKVVSSGYEHNAIIATWINSGSLNVNWSIKVDALSAVMLVVVTLVSSLVHIYSVGYMSHDPHKPRFMSYLSLFTFAMLTLVTSDNFLQLFFGWEGVGLCSYFLIGFWYKKETANAAAIKQFLLHTWLPDAMEGPTPVSALIHAATMVTAGVFLVVRCSPIYEYSELALSVITLVGMTTAFFAATVALVQTDIKKIIAYSTCSQLGYMFFAAGVGAYNVAMFHLFTHAFFKALLFLGSGSVIHSFKDEQDVTKMGGVFKKLPYTYALMVVGTLALTGFPFLSGFYSKDAIIEFAYISETKFGIYAAGIGVLTAVMTSIYSWRLIFKTFHGDYKNKDLSIDTMHESPLSMMLPLVLLAVGAVFSGFLFKELFIGHDTMYNFWGESIKFLEPLGKEHPPTWFLFLTPTLVVLTIPLSYYLFVKNTKIVNEIVSINMPVYIFLQKKWYFDELYDQIFIKPSKSFGIFLWKKIDGLIIDKFGPDGISNLVKLFSFKAVKFQSGYIYQYAFIMLLGFSILLTLLIVK